jgi:hypothetical protein
VVSELMTNALRHALPGSGHTRPRRPIRLGLPPARALRAVRGRRPGHDRSGATNARLPRRDRPRTAPHLRAQRPVGLHHAQPDRKGRVGPVHRTARTAFPGPVPGQARPRPGAGNNTLTTGTSTARRGPRAQGRPGRRDSAILSPPGTDAMAGRGSAGRAADLPGPTRPVPVASWCRRRAKYELGHGQGRAPVPAVHSPAPATLSGLVVREPGAPAGRDARPSPKGCSCPPR